MVCCDCDFVVVGWDYCFFDYCVDVDYLEVWYWFFVVI